ncbi:MAG: hypothetical protein EON56_03860 [Alphaproteobacteria bacterium]|nr:MAG: hypothetical protein EON56_03860 [Alphaproteobacteria bacterium]
MAVGPLCIPAPTQELRDYGRGLYARLKEAVHVQLVDAHMPLTDSDAAPWVPAAKECHDNVDIWVASHAEHAGGPQYEAVRGWLYFDLGGMLDCVQFAAHSVVRVLSTGQLIDITPNPTESIYPFLHANVDEATYQRYESELFASLGQSSIYHFP